jgi:Tol biopolymer transport system component
LSLTNGQKLGPYEIVGMIGAGGMGEVFRARDSRLGRDVAIKVMPEDLAENPDVRARFEREARAASALNHPSICQVYDIGREGSTDYIVMELLEGESLAQRLQKGPLTPPEVLRVGLQIADALDRAHRAGIVHRDLKPGNVMLTKQGAKLLDFGLARPTGLANGPGSGSRAPGTPSSPTMSRQLTAAGSIVGTFMYMAPEQLEGAEADARSDIWALGATLYEMATGKPAFEGRSQASLIAAILGKEPRPIAELAPLTTPGLERVVQACLAKDPEDRIQTAHDVRLQLRWLAEGGSQMGVPAPVAAHRRARERGAWIFAAVSTLVALGALGWIAAKAFAPKPVRHAVRFSVTSPPGTNGITWPRLSPDGSMIAFIARDSAGVVNIWVRPLSSTTAYMLAGTASTGRPFWSPDSKDLGFFANGKFMKVSAAGGPVQLVGESGNASDGTWGPKYVLFDAGTGDSIRAMPVTGGPIVPMTSFVRTTGENQHAWPFMLPDGKHFLFQSFRSGASRLSLIRLGTLGSLKSVVVDSSESRAEFLAPDHLVYVKDGAVIARRFDLAKGKVVGNPVVIGENAGSSTNTEAFTVSSTGSVAFQSSSTGGINAVVRHFDRAGKLLGAASQPANITGIALSPDGNRLALTISESAGGKSDIWIRDLKRGTQTRLTFDPGDDIWPVWSPRGDTIAFSSDRFGGYTVMTKPASGLSEEVRLPGLKLTTAGPIAYAADGHVLTVGDLGPRGDWDAYAVRDNDGAHPVTIAATAFNEIAPRISPDGRFVAYASAESGVPQIFAQPFPNPTGRWQVSVNGGSHPFWTAGGKEIVFRGLDGSIHAVPIGITPDGALDPGTPVRLLPGAIGGNFPGRWVPTNDGREFYLIQAGDIGRAEISPITVVLDANADLAGK